MKLKPLQDRVLIQPAEVENIRASGIIIPDTAKEKPQRGIIIAVGPGKKDEPMQLKEGDQVLYGKFAGTEISVEGKTYMFMRQADVFTTIED